MKQFILPLLCCPKCRYPVILRQCFLKESEEIIDGLLECGECHEWFPLIGGIPRLLIEELRRDLVLRTHRGFYQRYRAMMPSRIRSQWDLEVRNTPLRASLKEKTAKSFGYEWNTFHAMCEQYRKNFLDFIAPISESFFQGKIALDAGSGVGRHTYWAAQFGAKEVIGIDLSDAVEASYRNTRGLPNVHIIQADIYHLPFRSPFDYIFSIGVLHHLSDPELGFRSLTRHLKTGGTISIWVYGREHNAFHVYFNELIRCVTRHMPFPLLHTLCYLPAAGVELSNRLYRFLQRFKRTRQLAQFLPFKVYADFPFIVKVNDAFDIFATPKSSYWTTEQIRSWYKRAGIRDVSTSFLRVKSVKAYGKNTAQ